LPSSFSLERRVFFPRRRFQNKGTHNTHPRQARDGCVAAKHIVALVVPTNPSINP
jgi:hypothetical protein